MKGDNPKGVNKRIEMKGGKSWEVYTDVAQFIGLSISIEASLIVNRQEAIRNKRQRDC
jgi:hypothetical protein